MSQRADRGMLKPFVLPRISSIGMIEMRRYLFVEICADSWPALFARPAAWYHLRA